MLLSYFALNLSMIASVALAEPVTERISSSARLTESQMDTVTAGSRDIIVVSSARAPGSGSASSYAVAAIYGNHGKNPKIFFSDRPSAVGYSLHTRIVIKMDSIHSFRHFLHFSINK
jgi:hypothetical protein